MNVSRFAVTIRPLSCRNGGGFVAVAPELPGCRSDGETLEEALSNAYDAITCWIEGALEIGRSIPELRRAAA